MGLSWGSKNHPHFYQSCGVSWLLDFPGAVCLFAVSACWRAGGGKESGLVPIKWDTRLNHWLKRGTWGCHSAGWERRREGEVTEATCSQRGVVE